MPVNARGLHVVLVAYHFPPSIEVGAVRASLLARALIDAGAAVDVVRVLSAGEGAQGKQQGEENATAGLRVHSVAVRRGMREVARDVYRWCRRLGERAQISSSSALPSVSQVDSPAPYEPGRAYDRNRFSPARRVLLSLLRVPDDHQGFIPVGFARTLSVVRSRRSIIYCTAPPFSALVAATMASVVGRAPLVVELRDPWVGNPGFGAHTRSSLSDAMNRWMERVCLSRAALIVTVTESVATAVRARLSFVESNRVVVVPTGTPPDAVPSDRAMSPARTRRKLRIVYAGNLYLARDPRPILHGLAEWRRTRTHSDPEVLIEFVGDCAKYRGTPVAKWIAEYGLEEQVQILPREDRSSNLDRLRNADALLLLARGQASQIPHKVYEYIGVDVPIVALVDSGGDTHQLLTRVGGHYLLTDDSPQVVAAVIRQLIGDVQVEGESGIRRSHENREVLQELRSETQMQRLVQRLSQLRES